MSEKNISSMSIARSLMVAYPNKVNDYCFLNILYMIIHLDRSIKKKDDVNLMLFLDGLVTIFKQEDDPKIARKRLEELHDSMKEQEYYKQKYSSLHC